VTQSSSFAKKNPAEMKRACARLKSSQRVRKLHFLVTPKRLIKKNDSKSKAVRFLIIRMVGVMVVQKEYSLKNILNIFLLSIAIIKYKLSINQY